MLRTALYTSAKRLAYANVCRSSVSGGVVPSWVKFSVRNLATSSNNEVEYEIDVITLKKTPKKIVKPESVANDFVKFKLASDGRKLDPTVVEKTINQINSSFDPKLNDFVLRYSNELNVFYQFVQQSYGYKIKSFSQLTSTELLNSIYIFKDYYLKNKIPAINKYNYISYNYMFDNFLKLVKTHHDFPSFLHYLLLVNNHGLELLNLGIDSYRSEILFLHDALDLSQYSWTSQDLVNELDAISRDLEEEIPGCSPQNQKYHQLLIEYYRTKSLKSVLQRMPEVLPADLYFLMSSKNFVSICDAVNSTRRPDQSNSYYSKYLFMNNSMSALEILTKLDAMKKATPKAKELYENLLESMVLGSLHLQDTPLDFSFTKFKISNDETENYEFSLIFHTKLFNFVDELKILNSMGIDLSQCSLVSHVNGLVFNNILLKDRFNSLSIQLEEFFNCLAAKNSTSLYKLIQKKNWSDWCQENHNSKIPKMLIDYSNLSDYQYKQIQVDTELARSLPQLSAFLQANRVDLSVIRLNYLLDLFQDDFQVEDALRKLYLNNGDVSIQNLQELIENYNTLHFNLLKFNLSKIKRTENKPFKEFTDLELRKHFGYYGDLIKNPLILDNLQELYEDTNHNESTPVNPFEKLSEYKYELEILKVDELQSNFGDIASKKILSVLDKRIKEILSNLNPNPSSRLNYKSINKFIDLHRALIECFEQPDPETSVLDGFIEYRQIPDNFNLHEYADILNAISRDKGRFSEMSMGQVLKASSELINSTSTDLIYDYARYVKLDAKLRKLFKMNGGYTEVLDTICLSDSKFHEFEKLIQEKKKDPEKEPKQQAEQTEEIEEIEVQPKSVLEPEYVQPEYVQIPENTYIHEFTEELSKLRAERFPNGYKAALTTEILGALDNDINQFYADQVLPGHYVTWDNVDQYIKLSNNLSKLFNINGGHTEVLDAVIQSDSVFKQFEKRNEKGKEKPGCSCKKNVTSTYRQLPDDFTLHEYTSEIQQIKSMLESGVYYGHPIQFSTINYREVLDVLEFMAAEPSINVRKRQNFRKLAKNLYVLFKYNGYNTSILDNILVNNEVFNDVIGRIGATSKDDLVTFLREYKSELDEFFLFSKMNKFDLIDFYDLSEGEFSSKVSEFLGHVSKTDIYKYPRFKDLLERLLVLEHQDPMNLAVLFMAKDIQLDELNLRRIRHDIESFIKKLSSHRDLYKEETTSETLNEEVRDSVEVPVKKFDMNEFKDKEKVEEEVKEDIEEEEEIDVGPEDPLMTIKATVLTPVDPVEQSPETTSSGEPVETPVETSPEPSPIKYSTSHKFNIKEENLDDSELFVRNQIFHQIDNKEAPEVDELLKLSVEDIRANYKNSKKLNEENFRKYLENINHQRKSKDEEQYRQAQAYNWNRAQAYEKPIENKFFESVDEDSEFGDRYCLMGADGTFDTHHKNPLGGAKYQDALEILKELNEKELNFVMKRIDQGQKSSWKLVGGNKADKKLLFRTGSVPRKGGKLLHKIRAVFAFIGATFVALVWLNYSLSDPKTEPVLTPEVSPVSNTKSESSEDKGPVEVVGEKAEDVKSGWFWK